MLFAFEIVYRRSRGEGPWPGANVEGRYIKVLNVPIGQIREREARVGPLEAQYTYTWPDGHAATVLVWGVSSAEARALRKVSAGFLGYDWMVDAILKYGKIITNASSPLKARELTAGSTVFVEFRNKPSSVRGPLGGYDKVIRVDAVAGMVAFEQGIFALEAYNKAWRCWRMRPIAFEAGGAAWSIPVR